MGLIRLEDPDHQEILVWLCSALSYTVLAITFWYKGPQVYAVLHSGSSLGLSLPSLILEFTSYSIEMTYQIGMGYPLDTYFEIICMWAQDIILLYVVLENRHMIEPKILPLIVLYLLSATSIACYCLHNVIMYSLIGSTTVILSTSKSMQLYEVICTQNPGRLSALTWGLLSYLALVRILTTLVMTGDVLMLSNTTTAFILDVAVTVSIVYYNKTKAHRIQWRRAH